MCSQLVDGCSNVPWPANIQGFRSKDLVNMCFSFISWCGYLYDVLEVLEGYELQVCHFFFLPFPVVLCRRKINSPQCKVISKYMYLLQSCCCGTVFTNLCASGIGCDTGTIMGLMNLSLKAVIVVWSRVEEEGGSRPIHLTMTNEKGKHSRGGIIGSREGGALTFLCHLSWQFVWFVVTNRNCVTVWLREWIWIELGRLHISLTGTFAWYVLSDSALFLQDATVSFDLMVPWGFSFFFLLCSLLLFTIPSNLFSQYWPYFLHYSTRLLWRLRACMLAFIKTPNIRHLQFFRLQNPVIYNFSDFQKPVFYSSVAFNFSIHFVCLSAHVCLAQNVATFSFVAVSTCFTFLIDHLSPIPVLYQTNQSYKRDI